MLRPFSGEPDCPARFPSRFFHWMDLRIFAVFAAVALLTPCVSAQTTKPSAAPNVLFILIDDLGWADLGCYGNTFHETPHVDQLARQGMRFTDAYAAGPVCSPTRATLMTGRYTATVGITDFIPGHWRPWERLIVPPIHNQLPLTEVTLGEMLKTADYDTCYLGKWHLGGGEYFPDKQGFDTSLVQGGGHFGARLVGPKPVQLAKDEYLADGLTDQAIKFIGQHRDRPWFVYLSHYAVHIPLQAKQELIDKYEKKAASVEHASHPTYAAMVEHVDQSVGRLMQTLDELELTDDTVVIFFSDNGGLIRRFDAAGPVVTSNAPLRSEKGTVYEGGIRVPMIVRYPGKVAAGSECGVPVSSVDFMPTLAALAGAALPSVRIDGESLLPLLADNGSLKRDAIYWHYPHYHHMDPAGAIRCGPMKLIEHFDDGELELYHLADDIGETNNLAEAKPEQAAALRDKLAAWRTSVGAKMPTINPDHDQERADQWRPRRRPPAKKGNKK